MVGKYIIEKFAKIPTDVEPSSEYIYRETIADKNTLVIGISQSGETADTITAIKQVKEKGSHIAIITNRTDSTMARLADSLLPVDAGIEVSVAATKSYMAQLISLYLLAIKIMEAKDKTVASNNEIKILKQELIELPNKIEAMLENKTTLMRLTKQVKIYPQYLRNVHVTDKEAAQNDPDVQAAVTKAAEELGDEGRILVRPSGTEPLVRVMVEATTDEICRDKVLDVVRVIKEKGYMK